MISVRTDITIQFDSITSELRLTNSDGRLIDLDIIPEDYDNIQCFVENWK